MMLHCLQEPERGLRGWEKQGTVGKVLPDLWNGLSGSLQRSPLRLSIERTQKIMDNPQSSTADI